MRKEIEFISGYKFAEMSDVIFSGTFLQSQRDFLYRKENVKNNSSEHLISGKYITIKTKNFKLKENDIIFCKTEFIYELFSILKKQCKFKNIKLITHQSDMKISNKMYKKKPECISEWYSCNVGVNRPDLIPIPLGLANFHHKNLNENHFVKNLNLLDYLKDKQKLLYINFNPNTNFSHRVKIYNIFEGLDWAENEVIPVTLNKYKEKMMEHSYVIAPWGNGVDTHRFWEILYSGSIPITKKHILYESFKNLPKIQVDNYSEITENFLNEKLTSIEKNKNQYNLQELDFKFWKNKIKLNVLDTPYNNSVLMKNNFYFYYWFIDSFKYKLNSKLKFFYRVRRFIYKKIKI